MAKALNRKKIIIFLAMGLFTSLFWGCKPAEKAQKNKNDGSVNAVQAGNHKPGNTAQLIDIKKYEITENFQKAEELLRQYVDHYPQDPVGNFELSSILADKKNLDEAIRYAQKAYSLEPANLWYQQYLAELYKHKGDFKNAIILYEKMMAEHPENLDNYYQLAALYLMSEKYQEAVDVYDKIEAKTGISEEIAEQKEKIYLQLNEVKKAQAELEKLVESDPQNTKYLSILAEFFMSNKMPEKAAETYAKIQAIDPGNPYIHMSLADYYRKTGNKEKAFDELKLGFGNPNLDIDTKVNILLSFYTVNQLYSDFNDQAISLAKILIDTHPNEPKAHSIYADLLMQAKQYQEARDEFLKVINLDSSKYVVWEQVLRLDLQMEKYDHLLSYGKRTTELFPEQPLPYLFLGMADYQLKNFEDGVKQFHRGVKLVVENDELLSQFYMYLGDTWHALKNPDESDKAYEKAIQAKDNNSYALNNYSYYLSLRNKELDKAERMAKKAVTLEPQNASFEDTYGWVLYKLGRYDEARTWISKALEDKQSVSAEVLEHYGDVLFKLGETENALDYWIKAKNKGKGSDFLEKKITDKKLYE
jgi:tetratricopeptide (TPR) repeat protein